VDVQSWHVDGTEEGKRDWKAHPTREKKEGKKRKGEKKRKVGIEKGPNFGEETWEGHVV